MLLFLPQFFIRDTKMLDMKHFLETYLTVSYIICDNETAPDSLQDLGLLRHWS